MAETDTVGGKLTKQQWTILVGGGAAYVGYRWWRARQSSATAATTAGAAPGTPIGVDANGNPVYLNSSGAEVDASGNPDTVVTASGASGAGYTNPAPIASDGLPAAGTAPQTDEQWTQAVVADLQNLGYDGATIATAVGQYLASQPLTSAQVTIIRTAWSYEGRPPGEPNLAIIQAATGTTGTTGTSPTVSALKAGQVVQVPVQIEKGQNWSTIAAKAGISPAHLQINNPASTGAVGQVINVPVQVEGSATWQSIAAQWGISATHLQDNNPTLDHTPGTTGTTGTTVTSTV